MSMEVVASAGAGGSRQGRRAGASLIWTAALCTLLSAISCGLPGSAEAAIVAAYCSSTDSVGIRSSSQGEAYAAQLALQDCSIASGTDGCCTVIGTSYDTCMAVATTQYGSYGVGQGAKEVDASSAAVEDCAANGGTGCRAIHYTCER